MVNTHSTTTINPEELWMAVLGELQLHLPEHSYNTWLKGTSIASIKDKNVNISVTSSFALDWLERRCYQSIEKTLEKITGIKYIINFVIKSPNSTNSSNTSKHLPTDNTNTKTSFNPLFTFKNFIEGDNNSLALNASLSVASNRDNPYNPLFLYSDVGLGKTHLLHAIGHTLQTEGSKIIYTTGEKFTNEFIYSIRTRSTEQFKSTYSSVDLLLIDDIQFISGKEQTQEGFFHIFNDLQHKGTKIVITSDQAPEKLNNFQQRLSSRFESGLIADIQKPSLETRIAIIQHKLGRLELKLETSIIEMIAKHTPKNIRQIEGILNKLFAHTTLMNIPLNYQNTLSIIQSCTKQQRSSSLTKENILNAVAQHYQVTPEEILSKQRNAPVATARQVSMYLLKQELNLTIAEIGRFISGRNHSTVIHGINKITEDIPSAIKDIQNSLY